VNGESLSLQVSITTTEALCSVVFSGPLDEYAIDVLQTLEIDHPNVELDVQNIPYINSIGASAWIKWITSIASYINYTIHHCSPAFISQVNMLRVFSGRGDITSFFAPVICPQCESQSEILLEKPFDDKDQELKASRCRCGAPFEWEEPLEELLRFRS